MTSVDNQTRTKALRKKIREQRRALTQTQQIEASKELSKQLVCNLPHHIKRIAIYLASDGEIDPMPFIERCWQRHIEVYLPVLHPFSAGNLLFLRYTPDTKMVNNKYGISEPKLDVSIVLPANKLDIIYTPLVAFDAQGNRMGMGGGYYDRTLAANPNIATVGIAHDCQQVAALDVQPWDMPLERIVTPSQVIVPAQPSVKEI
ncbi:MAG: 5-formyltetrahydrofolate cyclo-ligase [Psychrobium sp.]